MMNQRKAFEVAEPIDGPTNLVAVLQSFSMQGRMAGLRCASAINYTTARQASDLLDVACPTIPVGSTEGMLDLIVSWLSSPVLSAEEKQAVVVVFSQMCREGVTSVMENEQIPLSVKLLLKDRGQSPFVPVVAEPAAEVELSGEMVSHADVPHGVDHPVEYSGRCGICIRAKGQAVR